MSSLPAHHDPRGGYRNPWRSSEPHGFGSFLKWMVTRRNRPPEGNVPRLATTGAVDSPGSGLSITWIGHSTFLIRAGGMSVLTDPIWSERASPFQFAGPRRHIPPGLSFDALPPIDAVFMSHDHYDHLDDATVRRLIARFPRTQWIMPLGVGPFFRARGAKDVTELDWWQDASFGSISAVCTPAQHFSGRYPWNRNATLWAGWVIGLGTRRVFFAGDTALHPEFPDIASRLGPFDLAVLPIGAYEPRWFMKAVHMNPEDAVAAYSGIAGVPGNDSCVFIPSHWGTFRLTDEPLDEPPKRLQKAWTEAALPKQCLYVLSPGETSQQD